MVVMVAIGTIRRRSAILACILAALSLASPTGASARPRSDAIAPVRLRVMEFNIEYGGDVVDFHSVIRAIRASHADVVGIEEAWGKTALIADRLGWAYADRRMQLISRFPLLDPPGADGLYTFVQLAPGRVVAIGNVHLPSAAYAPRKILLEGASRNDVLALERARRLPALRPSARALAGLADAGIPSFLLGDFNSPSQLDWTRETVGTLPQIRFPLRWPATALMERLGFRDSYREAHPDPLRTPGLTWPSGRRRTPDGWNPGKYAAHDRIDFVFAGGPARTVRSTIVGESGAADVGIAIDPWPSDHRAVVSTFSVRPGVPPTMVAVSSRLVTSGDTLDVTFHAPGEADGRVAIVPAGGDPATGPVVAERSTAGATDGTLTFPTEAFAPGAFQAVLEGSSGELARIPFWVQAAGAGPQIATTQPAYPKGASITVTWHGAPGNRWDWIGIYRAGADPNVASYLDWLYTGATIEGSATFDRDAHGAWPLPPGDYSVYLLEDDAYHAVAAGRFTVTAA